jgi:hypothetical protein
MEGDGTSSWLAGGGRKSHTGKAELCNGQRRQKWLSRQKGGHRWQDREAQGRPGWSAGRRHRWMARQRGEAGVVSWREKHR